MNFYKSMPPLLSVRLQISPKKRETKKRHGLGVSLKPASFVLGGKNGSR